MNDLDKFKPQRLGREKLYSIIENVAARSGCIITRLDKADESMPFEPFSVCFEEGKTIRVHIYAKNISGAGWSDKPEIKRIQVKKLPEIPRQTKDDFYVLCGVCDYDSQVILAAWDPQNYMTHNTCCSCYVYISSLEKAINGGLFHGLNKGKEVMTCSEIHFGDLLKEISSRYC